MKYFTAFLVAITLLVSLIPAFSAGGEMGARIGLTHSRAYLNGYSYSQWQSGLTASLFYSVPLSRDLELRPHVMYVSRRGVYRDMSSTPSGSLAEVGELSLKSEYLEFPVLVRLSVFGSEKVRPVFFAGPSLGYVLSSEYIQDGVLHPNFLGGTDWAAVVGLGLEMPVGNTKCGVEVSYRRALSGIGDAVPKEWIKFHGFGLLAGVSF